MTSLIRSESDSSLSLYLQEMDVKRMRDDVKTEALACGMWGFDGGYWNLAILLNDISAITRIVYGWADA